MFNFKNTISALGLDISDSTLKLAQVKTIADKTKIQALGKAKISKGIIENGDIIDEKEVIKEIQKIISKPIHGSFTGTEIVASLPETKTFIKLIEIEKSPNSLNKIIDSEFEKHVPYQAKEVYYDWQLVQETADSNLVLIGAAPKNSVNQYLDLLKKAKLSVNAFEIEAMPICRSLLAEESRKYHGEYTKNYCIIDIGAKRSSAIVYAKNTIALSLSIPISGDAVTDKISKTLQIKTDQAEKAKIVCGLDKSQAHGIVSDILTETVNELIDKINTTTSFFEKHYPKYGKIDEILLTGGGSNIRNLSNIITEATKINTSEANSLTNLDIDDKKDLPKFTEMHKVDIKDLKKGKGDEILSIKQDAGRSYTTAIGLALRSISEKQK